MDIKERIKQYIDAKGISTNMLETTIGISSGGFRKVKTVFPILFPNLRRNILAFLLIGCCAVKGKWKKLEMFVS